LCGHLPWDFQRQVFFTVNVCEITLKSCHTVLVSGNIKDASLYFDKKLGQEPCSLPLKIHNIILTPRHYLAISSKLSQQNSLYNRS
jgi:hypothetical protein